MTHSDSDVMPGITGVILAGGAGRRMGGADKGLISLQGRPLIEHVIGQLTTQVEQLIIVANRNLDTYCEYGHPVVSDAMPDYPGPLVGMLAGLSASNTSHVLFASADAPRIPSDLAAQLNKAGTSAVATDNHGWQPLFCLVSRQQLPALEEAIAQGERSPKRWLKSMQASEVDFTNADCIWSVNTPEELANLQNNPELAA